MKTDILIGARIYFAPTASHMRLCCRGRFYRCSPLTHNFFKTLPESCAELVWDKRCSNLVATFDQIYFLNKYIYFVWQCRWPEFAIERTHCIIIIRQIIQKYVKYSINMCVISILKRVISNVVTTLQQRGYLATYNVVATLFGNISPTFAQRCAN